jgi:CRP-like cAMP-binding protein
VGVAALSVSALDRLVLRLDAIGRLSEEERQAVRNLPVTIREFRPDEDIVREGDRPWQSCLLLEGFLQRYKTLPDGTRQIMSFHVPGDIPDLESLHLQVMDHSLATLTPSKVALISHDPLREVSRKYPHVADLFWRSTLIDAAIFREWIVNVGSRDAPSRIAHVICELYLRLKVVGLTQGMSFEAPITQSEIGEATGLSTVHVNRSVQKLRGDGLITLNKSQCTIDDWDGLCKVAAFDPTYLHQKNAASPVLPHS